MDTVIYMDDKGLIFTTDAVLALVIFIVFASAMVTYYAMPNYAGQDQQSLERIAADALRVMEYDGTLYAASSLYQAGDTSAAMGNLTLRLNELIPNNTGYKISIDDFTPVENDRGILLRTNLATRVQVLSAPKEGWMGRAWYKLEKAEFEDQQNNVTTTVWNFHNWLTNFNPWGSDGLYYNYWGGGDDPQNIGFSIPSDAVIQNAFFLIGSSSGNYGASYGINNSINGNIINGDPNQFVFLNYRPASTTKMYNFQGNISASDLISGTNNFYVNFINTTYNKRYQYDMAWYAIIANYTTNFKVPKGVINEKYTFPDAAGLAVPNSQELGGGNAFGRIYDLSTGTVTSLNTHRVMDWATFRDTNRNLLDNYDDGLPFVIDNVNGEDGSAVSVIREFDLPNGTISILDGAVFVNAYGATDNGMVEVWDGSHWETVFCSFNFPSNPGDSDTTYSGVGDGYGNIPGIIYVGDKLKAGHNKIRITVWDQVPNNDYDLVGIVDCYVTATYTKLPIKWNNFPFSSYQSTSYSYTQEKTFTTETGAREVYLFAGAGTDTKNYRVQIRKSGTWYTLYNSNVVPYSLNLASLDAGGPKAFTSGNAGNYTVIPGTYRVRVTVTAPSSGWQSGDANAEIFSGNRVSVLYPEFLSNIWTAAYSADAETARLNAIDELNQTLHDAGYDVDPDLFRSEALYTGDMPNSIPIRLDLWRG